MEATSNSLFSLFSEESKQKFPRVSKWNEFVPKENNKDKPDVKKGRAYLRAQKKQQLSETNSTSNVSTSDISMNITTEVNNKENEKLEEEASANKDERTIFVG